MRQQTIFVRGRRERLSLGQALDRVVGVPPAAAWVERRLALLALPGLDLISHPRDRARIIHVPASVGGVIVAYSAMAGVVTIVICAAIGLPTWLALVIGLLWASATLRVEQWLMVNIHRRGGAGFALLAAVVLAVLAALVGALPLLLWEWGMRLLWIVLGVDAGPNAATLLSVLLWGPIALLMLLALAVAPLPAAADYAAHEAGRTLPRAAPVTIPFRVDRMPSAPIRRRPPGLSVMLARLGGMRADLATCWPRLRPSFVARGGLLGSCGLLGLLAGASAAQASPVSGASGWIFTVLAAAAWGWTCIAVLRHQAVERDLSGTQRALAREVLIGCTAALLGTATAGLLIMGVLMPAGTITEGSMHVPPGLGALWSVLTASPRTSWAMGIVWVFCIVLFLLPHGSLRGLQTQRALHDLTVARIDRAAAQEYHP